MTFLDALRIELVDMVPAGRLLAVMCWFDAGRITREQALDLLDMRAS